jgi:hypothetical protein
MATCKYCGKWAGVASDEHDDCSRMASEGKTAEEIRYLQGGTELEAAPPPVSFKTIFWAIFAALWAFSVSAGLIVFVLRALVNA